MAAPNDPESYERAELEQRVRAGLSPEPPNPPLSRRRFGRILDFLDASRAGSGAAGDDTWRVTAWQAALGQAWPIVLHNVS